MIQIHELSLLFLMTHYEEEMIDINKESLSDIRISLLCTWMAGAGTRIQLVHPLH